MITAQSSTVMLVTWDMVPPIDQNGIITVYQVNYRPLQTFGGVIGAETVNVTGLTAILTDLEEAIEYNISVRAYTRVGVGPHSENLINMTLTDGELEITYFISTTVSLMRYFAVHHSSFFTTYQCHGSSHVS